MAPKRSAGRGKAGEAAGDDAEVHGWMSSKCADSHLLDLVGKHLLQPRNVIHWRRSDGESFPHEGVDESVVFHPHVLRGLCFPVSDFFRCLLHHKGVHVYHLTPNSILHISIFVHLCEAFLGIEPHFDLFQYFFHLKPHPNDSGVDVVGGAGLQFRQGKKPRYIPYELSDNVIDWKSMWFYVRNLSSSLPLHTPGPPVKKPSWNSRRGRVDQVNFLLGEIERLKTDH